MKPVFDLSWRKSKASTIYLKHFYVASNGSIDPLKKQIDLRFVFSTAKYNAFSENEGLTEENSKEKSNRKMHKPKTAFQHKNTLIRA